MLHRRMGTPDVSPVDARVTGLERRFAPRFQVSSHRAQNCQHFFVRKQYLDGVAHHYDQVEAVL